MPQDPTLALIESLKDDSKWATLERVAVFRAHDRCDENGKVNYTVTDEDLKTIAANTEAAFRSAGQPVRLTIGHTFGEQNIPESYQPELYGFAVGYKVERVRRPDGDYLAVTQIEKIKPEYVEKVKHLPYRSVEYNHEKKIITGCAALIRTPYLQLGAVIPYSTGTSSIYHYSLGVPAVADQNYAQSAQMKAIHATKQTDDDGDFLGWTSSKQRRKEGYSAEEEDEEDYKSFSGFAKKHYAKMSKYMKRYEAESSDADKDKDGKNYMNDKDNDDDKSKEVANSAVGREVAYALAQIDALKAAAAADRRALITERTARMLDPLEELISFDRSRELAYMAAMPTEEDRAAHVNYMLAHYSKLPTGGMIPTFVPGHIKKADSAGDHKTNPTVVPPSYEKIMAYVRANPGISYAAAEAKIIHG